jgi:hypothetical protein
MINAYLRGNVLQEKVILTFSVVADATSAWGICHYDDFYI